MAESRNKMQKLLTIGLFSKITNISIKSLRYYERIGIFSPAYIDEKTGYRYYSFSQIYIIDAIRFCLELDIPLKTFKSFLSEDKTHIYYNKLLEYGSAVAQQKLKKLKEQTEMLNFVQKEIVRSENCLQQTKPEKHFLEKKHCLIFPYEGQRDTTAYNKCLTNILIQISENGWKGGYEIGLLSVLNKEGKKQYIYAEFLPQGKKISAKTDNILVFPAGEYLCQTTPRSFIHQAEEVFAKEIRRHDTVYFFETELFTGDFNFSTPYYELRCLAL